MKRVIVDVDVAKVVVLHSEDGLSIGKEMMMEAGAMKGSSEHTIEDRWEWRTTMQTLVIFDLVERSGGG